VSFVRVFVQRLSSTAVFFAAGYFWALAEDFWKGILDTVLAIDLAIWGAIHTSLEGFQSIDLFLRLAAVPALRKHIPDDVDRRTSKT
jgi:hypothetical protein